MDNIKHRRLQPLDRSDFSIVKGEPDIRGWDVRNAAGQKIGEVEELVIDAQQKKVRYMVVELDDDEMDLEDDKKVLIPIGLAQLHKDDDDVLLPGITVEQLRALPAYDEDNLDEEAEQKVCTTLGRKRFFVTKATNTGGQQHEITTPVHRQGQTSETEEYGTDFYQHDYYNDDNLYKNRLHQAQQAQSAQGNQESDYERGLRLWEQRSEGGIIAGDNTANQNRERELSEEKRLEMVHNRRKLYEDRRTQSGHQSVSDRHPGDNAHQKKDNTIIQRIKDEGLRDVGKP